MNCLSRFRVKNPLKKCVVWGFSKPSTKSTRDINSNSRSKPVDLLTFRNQYSQDQRWRSVIRTGYNKTVPMNFKRMCNHHLNLWISYFFQFLGILDDNGKRRDVDRDIVLLVTVVDENMSYYIERNIQEFCTDPDRVDPGRWHEV